MSKRFTDTTKWEDPWFFDLEYKYKMMWLYICDKCDNAGVWKVNFKIANFFIGDTLGKEETLKAFGDRIKIMDNGNKWFIKRFIFFQCGELKELCKPHQHIISLLKNHNLFKDYSKGINTLKEKDKDKDKEKDKEKKAWQEKMFEIVYKEYPNTEGKKEARLHFNANIHNEQDFKDVCKALENYKAKLAREKTEPKYIKMASTWFNNWQDYLNYEPVKKVEPKPVHETAFIDEPKEMTKSSAEIKKAFDKALRRKI